MKLFLYFIEVYLKKAEKSQLRVSIRILETRVRQQFGTCGTFEFRLTLRNLSNLFCFDFFCSW